MSSRFWVDPADEILILTTKDGTPIGQATRRACHQREGKTHWGLLAVIKRSNGDIILARRSSNKSVFANIWDGSVATHVLPEDTPEKAAKRETKEELGVDVHFTVVGGYYYFTRDGDHAENEFCTLLVGVSDDTVHPLPTEVSEVKELSPDALGEKIKCFPSEYSPWLKEALKKFTPELQKK